MLGGLFAFALASAAFVVAGQAHWLGVARFEQGAAAAAFSPAAGAALASLGGRKRTGRLFGGYGGAKSIGYLAGPLVGGALVDAGGYSLLFIVLAALAGAVTVLVFWTLPGIPPIPRVRSTIAALARRVTHPSFFQPVLILAVGTAALSASSAPGLPSPPRSRSPISPPPHPTVASGKPWAPEKSAANSATPEAPEDAQATGDERLVEDTRTA